MIIVQLVQVALPRNEQGFKFDFEKNKIKIRSKVQNAVVTAWFCREDLC